MDRIDNPFTPGAGSPPPALLGRDELLKDAEVLFVRTKKGRNEKSMIMTGLRGVGKTVLLNRMDALARKHDYHTLFSEISEGRTFIPNLVQLVRRELGVLSSTGISGKVRKALAVLKSFTKIRFEYGDFSVGLEVDPLFGTADSGDLEMDLTDLFIAVGETAMEKKTGIAIILDEIQFLKKEELTALILAMHRMQQMQLPVALVGAGLPIMYELSGNAKSYSERLFQFPMIGPLNKDQTKNAINIPIQKAGESITDEALDTIYEITQGYPYFVQEWGYQVWNTAEISPIGPDIIEKATPLAMGRLDEQFFRVRFNRLTMGEKRMLRAMAGLGQGVHKTSDIATALNTTLSNLSNIRRKLIQKGMIYSPQYGLLDFTVPLFGDFMLRAMPEIKD